MMTTLEQPLTRALPGSTGMPTNGAPSHAVHRAANDPRKLFVHVVLLIICAAFLLPFVWMLSTSLKPLDQAMEFPPRFVPRSIPLYHHNGSATPIPQNYVD